MIFYKYERIWKILNIILVPAAFIAPIFFTTQAWEWALVSAGLIVVLMFIVRALSSISIKALFNEYYEKLKINSFIQRVNQITDSRYAPIRTRLLFAFILVSAYISAGKLEDAYTKLRSIDMELALKYHHIYALYRYQANLVRYYLFSDDIRLAEITLDNLLIEIERHKESQKTYQKFNENYLFLRNQVLFYKKEYQSCKEYFIKLFNAREPYTKIFAAYYLGIISLENNENDKAKDYFAYAAKNGNDLFITQMAKEQLT